MRVGAETFFVFGWPWWPFDGAVTAALIALLGTAATVWFNAHQFKKSEDNQSKRHTETIDSTKQLSGREQLLIDLRRAEDALASDDQHRWVYAGVTLQEVRANADATDDDRRRARRIIKGYSDRLRS